LIAWNVAAEQHVEFIVAENAPQSLSDTQGPQCAGHPGFVYCPFEKAEGGRLGAQLGLPALWADTARN